MNVDIFVSHHTSSSLHIVEAIVNKLEGCGLKCWYAPRDTQGHYAGSIADAIDSCAVFLLVLNKPASESFHVLNELELVCDRLARGESVHVIPFHVADQDISRDARYYIKRMHWIEAVKPPMYARIEELVGHINRTLGREPAALSSGNTAPSAPAYKLVSKLPQTRDVFQGRQELLERMDALFAQGKRAVFLEGIGGIGKSELAKQYALNRRDHYDTVVFATYTTSLKSLMADATSLVIEGLEPRQDESEEEYFSRKLQILRSITDERTLLILDNFDVDSDPDLAEFLAGRCHVIITTRNAHPGYSTLKVEAIRDKAVLLDIFEQNYGMALAEAERAYVEEIFELVEYHTYAVELIAKQMEASFLSAGEMLDMLRRGGMETSGQEQISGRQDYKSAFGHICSVFNTGKLSQREQQLMRYMALMGTRGVPAAHFRDWAELSSMDEVNALMRKSWIRREAGGRISLHPLVREVVWSVLEPGLENCLSFLRKAGGFCYFAWFRPYTENLAVGDCILSILQSLKGPGEQEWKIFSFFANFLWQLGKFEDAIHYGHQMYDAVLRLYGEASMASGYAAKSLAGCYFNSGKRKESVSYYRKGLACMLASGAPESEDLAMSYEKVARCLTWEYEQDLEKAEELFKTALDIRLRLREQIEAGHVPDYIESPYEPYSENIAIRRIGESYMEMGRMYQSWGQYEKAVEFSRRHLELLETYCRNDVSGIAYSHYDMGVSRYHLAMKARADGNEAQCMASLALAEQELRTALESNLKMRGALALDTIDNQEYLADTLAAMGNYGAASNEYMAVISMVEGLMGPDHPRLEAVKKKMEF